MILSFQNPKPSPGKAVLVTFAFFLYMGATGFAATSIVDPMGPNSAQAISAGTAAAKSGSQVLQKITVSGIHGDVFLRREGNVLQERITSDTDVRVGDSLKTETGTCELLMENHTTLTLQPNTTLEITEATYDKLNQSRATTLKLSVGRLKAKIGKLAHGSKFEVLTPTALAAVRGTVFYLDAGTQLGKLFTELYVDESTGGVVFRNTKTGAEFLIPKFGASSAFEDGSILASRFLTEQERKEFMDHWENAINQVLGQQDTEEKSTGDSKKADDDSKSDSSDSDKWSERNVSGSALNEFIRRLLEALSKNARNEWTYDAVKYDDGTSPLTEETTIEVGETELALKPSSGPGDQGVVTAKRLLPDANLKELRDAERSQMREEIHRELERIKSDIEFEDRVAQFEKTLDAQTGKVFTDIHGNRVRVDQYIFKPSDRSVEILALTLRTSGVLKGISSAAFSIDFNRDFTGALKDLPWSDYFNVVTRDEMAKKLGIPQTVTISDGEGGSHVEDNPNYQNLSEQYILHEKNPVLAQGDKDHEALFPEHFYVEFSNPVRVYEGENGVRDTLRFDEIYSSPETYRFAGTSSPNEIYTIQEKLADSTRISPAGDFAITVIYRHNQEAPEFYIDGILRYTPSEDDGESQQSVDLSVQLEDYVYNSENEEWETVTIGTQLEGYFHKSSDGSQTPGFAEEGLQTIDHYRTQGSNEIAPAYFHDRYRFDYGDETHDKSLIGIFVPIDNAGNILKSDAPDGSGFTLHGLRDLLSPNPHINGGKYNLEIMFTFGNNHPQEGDDEGLFTPIFSIDTIVTPELVNGTGDFNMINDSLEFPATLEHKYDNHDGDGWSPYDPFSDFEV